MLQSGRPLEGEIITKKKDQPFKLATPEASIKKFLGVSKNKERNSNNTVPSPPVHLQHRVEMWTFPFTDGH